MLRTSLFSWMAATAVAFTGLLVTQSPAQAAEKFSSSDKEMVDSVLGNLRMGMESGKLARDRANHKVVKDYAADLVRNNQKLWDELRDIAKAHNYTADDDLSKNDTKMKSQLKELEGQDFDAKFLKMAVHENQQLVQTFRKGADNADSSDLKKFYEKNESVVRANLDDAQKLTDKVSGDDSDKKK